jgi:hypothetical protein
VSGVRRLVAVLLVVVFLASPVQAVIIPDPVEAGLLAKIEAVLAIIHEYRMKVLAQLEAELQTRIDAYAFPSRLFDAIRATTTTVVDIRRELQRLGCAWPITERTLGLKEMLEQRTRFCRTQHQGIWGSHEQMWDAPVQEANDYIAVLTANMISERTEKTNTSWVRAHRDLFDEHTILRSSPGEANRAEAAALAWANQVAVGNSQIATQHLLVRQMSRALERFDQKKAADLTFYYYRSVATMTGRDWRGTPPAPGEEDVR